MLDVGCGAGQTLVACDLPRDALIYGIDPDHSALKLGSQWSERIRFVQGKGESLPFRSGRFELVIARLSLPYMNIPAALTEICRVLSPGGMLWAVLHSFSMIRRRMFNSIRNLDFEDLGFCSYLLFNGISMDLVGKLFAFPFHQGQYESFQTNRAIRRALCSAGFAQVKVSREKFFLVTARKPEAFPIAGKTDNGSPDCAPPEL